MAARLWCRGRPAVALSRRQLLAFSGGGGRHAGCSESCFADGSRGGTCIATCSLPLEASWRKPNTPQPHTPEKPRKRVTPFKLAPGVRCWAAALAKLSKTTLSVVPGMCCGPVAAGSSGAPWLLLLLLLLAGSLSASRDAADGCTACGHEKRNAAAVLLQRRWRRRRRRPTLMALGLQAMLHSYDLLASMGVDQALTRLCCRARQAAAGEPSAVKACKAL